MNVIKLILDISGAIHVMSNNFKMNLINGQVKIEKLMNLFKKYNSMQIITKKLLNGFHLTNLRMSHTLLKGVLAQYTKQNGLMDMDLFILGIVKKKTGIGLVKKMFA